MPGGGDSKPADQNYRQSDGCPDSVVPRPGTMPRICRTGQYLEGSKIPRSPCGRFPMDRGLLESKRTCTGRSPSRNHVVTVLPTAPLGNDLFVMGINTFVLGTRWGDLLWARTLRNRGA
jgi:hypothetical protein